MKLFSKILVVVIMLAVAVTFSMNANNVKAATLTVDLGTATPFAILAGTPAITDAGNASAVTGNVGLSPSTAAAIGLYCSQVDGTIYGVNAAYVGDGGLNTCFAGNPPLSNKTIVDNAKLDLTAAYLDAAGRTPVTTIDTELGGQTLTSGVYTSESTAFGITAGAGPLILDGEGDANAVFIFEGSDEEAGALTVGPGSEVQFADGAQACNVFWRVYGASIDTTAVFKGSILALTSITVADGANIEGRLLAQTGQVTLANDTITVPICVAPESTSTTTSVTELPQTGSVTSKSSIPWYMAIPVGIIAISIFLYFARRKQTA